MRPMAHYGVSAGDIFRKSDRILTTIPELLLLGMVRNMINEIGDDAVILIIGHSHGGIKLRNLGLMLGEKYRKNVMQR